MVNRFDVVRVHIEPINLMNVKAYQINRLSIWLLHYQ